MWFLSCCKTLQFQRHVLLSFLLVLRSVWVEEGSTPGCVNCLLNNLDLTVSKGGTTYYPNGLTGPDAKNSAERVILPVNQNDFITVTVTASNLSKRSQKFALAATGCFASVANQLYANGECSVFECDDSKDKRLQTILMAIFIPLGAILLFCIGYACWRKRKQSEVRYP